MVTLLHHLDLLVSFLLFERSDQVGWMCYVALRFAACGAAGAAFYLEYSLRILQCNMPLVPRGASPRYHLPGRPLNLFVEFVRLCVPTRSSPYFGSRGRPIISVTQVIP